MYILFCYKYIYYILTLPFESETFISKQYFCITLQSEFGTLRY